MIGRAGRPQFDTSATAIIMTSDAKKSKYDNLLSGTQKVESSLHEHLCEHLNSEIVLGTITDIQSALNWIQSTYFYVRVRKNPRQYKFEASLDQLEVKLRELIVRSLNDLDRNGLVTFDELFDIRALPPAALMSRYYLAFDTMKLFAGVKGQEDMPALLNALCEAKELGDIVLRRSEKVTLGTLNKDKHKPTIRFPFEGKVKDAKTKVSILVQASLGSLSIQDPALNRESLHAVHTLGRLAKCLVEFLWAKKGEGFFKALKSSVTLAKCVKAGMWEDSKFVSRQFERVGLAYSTALVHAGITSFDKIVGANPRDLEMILNKQPPFGNHLRNCATKMPKYALSLEKGEGKVKVMAPFLLMV